MVRTFSIAALKCILPGILLLLPFSARAQVALTLETSRTGEPISPYIYGQFIEHLGRCIYGGLWAEMVDDRKFYYPVTDTYAPWGTTSDPNWNAGEFRHLVASPWKIIGPAGSVTMDTVTAFVGKNTSVIKLPGNGTEAGISQEGLAAVNGKEYTGYVYLAGTPDAGPIEIRLVLGGNVLRHTVKSVTGEFKKYPFTFKAGASDDNVRIEVAGKGNGSYRIGTISLMPSDNVDGWRPDVLKLIKELDSPIYRWPGGNFVSGYNWRDGIGDRDRRPPRKNPAWTGVEPNDVGLHEFMNFVRMIGTEPYIAVNTGLGTVEEVAEEVAYCNSPADTPMGKLRAQNGHPEPFNVKWWAVGNEMFGSWQLGHMPLEDYVAKHNKVVDAMWKVDKNIKLVGVGEVGRWSETMLKLSADHMDLISEHIYSKDKTDVRAHVRQLADMIRYRANAHRKYRSEIPELKGKDIRIAMDEWNYWYGDYIYGELGVQYFHKDALGIAAGLHEFFRNSDIYYMANYAQTVNVIGAIKTSRTNAAFDATGLPLVLYRRQFGTVPIQVDSLANGYDVAAAWTTDRKAITVAVVNPAPEAGTIDLKVNGATPSGPVKRWIIANNDPLAHNTPDQTPVLTIKEENYTGGTKLQVPGYGIVLYRFEVAR